MKCQSAKNLTGFFERLSSSRRYLSSLVGGRTRSFSGVNGQQFDQICELASSNLRFGNGSTGEVGQDLSFMRCKKVLVVTDERVQNLPPMEIVKESLTRSQIEYEIFSNVRIEPNDVSFQKAIQFFSERQYDAVIALGGGSVIDTAKAANLYASHPPPEQDFYHYVNAPLGKGLPIQGELPPLIAIPTTAGTGSETTGIAIFDDTMTRSKTGIANRKLKPTLGIIDPENTKTLPSSVATFAGLDVLCHALESYTALPFDQRPKPSSPAHRPAYQGSNPISDVWALFALETTANFIRRAVAESGPDDEEARKMMLLASSAAGLGFGNAGVHLCHGMSYSISSQVKQTGVNSGYHPEGYPTDHVSIPHGLSVIVNAPAVFTFTGPANRERHGTCARILKQARTGGSGTTYFPKPSPETGLWLADEIRHLMEDLKIPVGLKPFGYEIDDIPALVEGTLPQHRVTKLSPRPVERKDLEDLFLSVFNEE